RQAAPQLGVPHQRREVVERHRHADVVDRRVREPADGPVGAARPAEHPDVARAGQLDRTIQRDHVSAHRDKLSAMRWWKWVGLAGLAGVAATGVVTAAAERKRRAYTPDEIRERLHERADEAEAAQRAET